VESKIFLARTFVLTDVLGCLSAVLGVLTSTKKKMSDDGETTKDFCPLLLPQEDIVQQVCGLNGSQWQAATVSSLTNMTTTSIL
jgi:hypothetical protein